MPNPIKYSTGSETLALKKGNFYIGTGDVGKGPTSTTGYYNGITPPSGGYTIYLNKASGGPSIYTCANDAELISITNSIAGTSYTTANECLVYFAGQTDKMVLNRDYESIVTDGLVLNVDAGFTPSYPKNGTAWYDLSGNGNSGTLTNGPTFNSANGGSIVFDGTNDYVQVTSPFGDIDWSIQAWSFCAFMKLDTLGNRCLVNLNSANSSHYIVTNVFYTGDRSYWYFIKNSTSTQTNFTQTTGNFPANEVFHFTMTYNGNGLSTGNVKFYKNGELLTTTNGGSAGLSNQSGLQIGGNYWFDGNIYNFLMYDKVLTSDEIIQNFNAQKSRFGL